MNLFRRTWWLYGFLAVLAGPLLATEYTGKVVGVSDGDSPRRLTRGLRSNGTENLGKG